MLKKLAFPTAALAVLVGVNMLTPSMASAGEACNNKICSAQGSSISCIAQENGPNTNCTGAGANCSWSACQGQ